MVMEKVLLISPSYRDMAGPAGAIVPPLGLAYIASYLRENNVQVKIIDCTPLHLTIRDLADVIRKEDPTIIGISSTTPIISKSREIADMVKKVRPDVTVILGGPHATAQGKEILAASKSIDIAVVGEGELTMLDLVNELEKRDMNLENVMGIIYKEQDKICVNKSRPLIENLDELPFPARDLLPMNKYKPSIKWYYRMPFTTMFTSRGCPFNCIFCDSHLTFGRRTRFRTAQNVVAEIEEVVAKWGVKELIFYDDTFTLNKKHVNEICELILKKDIDITWGGLARVDTIDEKLFKKMKNAGCHIISFGIESGSEEMLRIIKKKITLQQAEKAIELTKKVGIESAASFILGIPGETHETLQKTIDFAKKIDPTYAEFFNAVPFPGTELYQNLLNQNKLTNFSWENYTELHNAPVIELESFTKKELEHMSKKAYRTFYFRYSKIYEYMSKMTSVHRLNGYLRALKTFARLT